MLARKVIRPACPDMRGMGRKLGRRDWGDPKMSVKEITYFSDVLCIWAYVAQARIDAVKEKFGNTVQIKHHFCSVFADTARKIPSNWGKKDGYKKFNAHLRKIADRFPHLDVHPQIWLSTRPPTSASAHLFLKAVQQWEHETRMVRSHSSDSIFDQVIWAFRCGFFRDCRDIACWNIQCEIAEKIGVDIVAIEKNIHNGIAFANLAVDYQNADKMHIEGSPSFVLNEGRQKLYGNVGFRVMEANIQELLRTPRSEEASWC